MKKLNKTFLKLLPATLLSIGLITVCGCSNPNFRSIGSGILGSTGVISYSQADAMFEAGEGFYNAAKGFTPEEEYYLGRGVSAEMLSKYPPLANAQMNQYVSRIGTMLVAFSDRPEMFGGYHFQVIDSPEINAFASPGGFIFVTRGLIMLTPNEDALASVIAHEIGHVVANDGVNAISQANMTHALTVLGREAANEAIAQNANYAIAEVSSVFTGSVSDVMETLVTKGYSRSQEYAADKYAATLLKRAGYNPYALVTMMEKMETLNATGGMFSTHPAPKDRKEEILDVIGKEPKEGYNEALRVKRFSKIVKPVA